MSTTVTYKGSTLTTVENATKKLTTQGTWLEDDITITDVSSGGGGGSVLVVDTPDEHGGTIREITAQNTILLQNQKQVVLSSSLQTITPDTGYDGFRSVVVDAGEIGTVTQDEDGYLVLSPNGGGGSKTNIDIGLETTPIPNILNMFYALESGTAKTGEFTLTQSIPNTEVEIFDTELSVVHGLFIVDESQGSVQSGNTPENVMLSLCFNPTSEGTAQYAFTETTVQMTTSSGNGMNKSFLTRCSWRVDSGKLYCTGTYNRNNNYTPFYPAHTYRWVAW